jgi:hypothetical protein
MQMLLPLGLTLALAASAQQDGRVREGERPVPPQHGEFHAIADPALIRSFRELCGKADAIVEGVVNSDMPRLISGRAPRVETDFGVSVDRVLKGPTDTPEIAVSEMGGTFGDFHLIMNFPLLQRGTRYVLFLYADKREGIPPIPGLPRYLAQIFYGTYRVEEGRIQPFFLDRFPEYTGLTTEAFAAEIYAELKR